MATSNLCGPSDLVSSAMASVCPSAPFKRLARCRKPRRRYRIIFSVISNASHPVGLRGSFPWLRYCALIFAALMIGHHFLTSDAW
jgi:hypothetical protein